MQPAVHPCDEFLDTPSQELLSATWRARETTMRGGPESPIRRLREVLDACRDDLPRALGLAALPGGIEDLSSACRNNQQLYELGNLLAERIELAALATSGALRAPSYLPRSRGGSRGDQNVLVEADLEDFSRFADYAGRVACQLIEDAGNPYEDSFFATSRIPSQMMGRVVFSAVQATLFTYLRQRLPGMFYHGEWDSDPPPEVFRAGIEGRNKLLVQVQRFAEDRCQRIQSRVQIDSSVRSHPRRHFALTFLNALWEAIDLGLRSFTALQWTTELYRPPSIAKRPLAPSCWPYPLLNTRGVWISQPEHFPEFTATRVNSADRYYHLTHATTLRRWEKRVNCHTGETQSFMTLLCRTRPGGPASLNRDAFIPLRRFLHPEDPVVLRSEAMEIQADELARLIAEAFRDLDVPQEALVALAGAPRVQFVRRLTTRKRWFGLGKDVPIEVAYLLLPQKAAAALELPSTPLPASERRQLQSVEASVDDDARVVWWDSEDWGDDDEGNGNEEPPQPPLSPKPERVDSAPPELVKSAID